MGGNCVRVRKLQGGFPNIESIVVFVVGVERIRVYVFNM